MVIRPVNIPLGTVVHDTDGDAWVYFGYKKTRVPSTRYFFRVAMPNSKRQFLDYEYNAVHRATLIKKFPDLEPYLPEDMV